MHATTPKGIVGGFEFTVVQRNLKELQERPWTFVWSAKKSKKKSRFDSYSVRDSVLIISHITLRNCRVHISSDNLSQNSCIHDVLALCTNDDTNFWSLL